MTNRSAQSAGRRQPFPIAPDLPTELAAPPRLLQAGDVWEQVRVDSDIQMSDDLPNVELKEVFWKDAQLVGHRFHNLRCADVRFEGGDLAGAVFLDCELTRVAFVACRMTGAIFAGARLRDVNLIDCVANLTDFRMAHLRRSAAENSNLQEADFYSAVLTDVRLVNCDLTTANFDTARPERLDLRGSTVDAIRGVTSLSRTQVTSEQLLPLGASLVNSLDLIID